MGKEISLDMCAVTTVDDADYTWLNQWNWHLSTAGYAVRPGKPKIRMHRVILEAPLDMEVDHINRNRLDNRRANLRLCTDAQTAMNRTKQRRKCSSKYKGVCWSKEKRRWMAHIQKNYEQLYLGYFEAEEDAARAYNKAARELHGEFAALNEIS